MLLTIRVRSMFIVIPSHQSFFMSPVGLFIFLFAYEATRSFMISVLAWGLGTFRGTVSFACRHLLVGMYSTDMVLLSDCGRSSNHYRIKNVTGEDLSELYVQVILPHKTSIGQFKYFNARVLVSRLGFKCLGRSNHSVSLCRSVLGGPSESILILREIFCVSNLSPTSIQIDVPFLSENVALMGYAFDYVPTNFAK
jgi:hypothetical protein